MLEESKMFLETFSGADYLLDFAHEKDVYSAKIIRKLENLIILLILPSTRV